MTKPNNPQKPFKSYLDYEMEKLALKVKALSPQEYEKTVKELSKRMGI